MSVVIDAVVSKRYPGCDVLRAAKMHVRAGTVHALVGENGAGKSTLVKIIAGVVRAESGSLAIGGTDVGLAKWTRQAARAAGIGIVQQHGAFAGALTIVENAVLGVEPTRGPLLDLDATATALQALGTRVGLPIDARAQTDKLSLGAAQRAEIVAALHQGAKILVLDEPTAVLAPIEVDGLLATLRTLAAGGTTIIIVTHKLDEVRTVADDVTVLRAGATVATFTAAAEGPRFDVAEIARAMVGADLPEPNKLAAPAFGAKDVLELEKVTVGRGLRGVSLTVRSGEIVGVAGVDGNGQRELALAVAGLVRHTNPVRIGGKVVTQASPRARFAAGLAHIPEDRQHGGLVLDATIAENLSLGRPDITGTLRIDRARVAQFAKDQIAALDIRPPNPSAVVRALSGGNQQKVVVARELSRPNLTCVLACQPTRGVDLGAVARIHDRLRAAASGGAGVLVISADLDELLALCHRVLVLLRGAIVGERSGADLHTEAARADLGALMTGAEVAA